jgi:5-methylcytosine-specific restriction endonuclease McrA
MYKCDECDKSFDSKQGLGTHKTIHRSGPRYSVSRRKTPETFSCLNCGNDHPYSHSSTNKYCSNLCYRKHRWKTVSIPRFESGEISESKTIRRHLIERYGEQCVECGCGTEYNGKPLTLQVDHIDGNSDNNMPDNLRLLCPNCHSQTETYGSKGAGSRYKKHTKRNTYLREYKAP